MKIEDAIGCSKTGDYNVVTSNPTASFTISTSILYLNKGKIVALTNTSKNAIKYTWDFGNGAKSTSFSPTATYNSVGNFNILLTAYDKYSCSDTMKSAIKVVLSDNIDGLHNNVFEVYPNPFVDKLKIKLNDVVKGKIAVSITDINGRVLFKKEFSDSDFDGELNMSSIPSGLYYLTVNNNGKQYVKTILKK